MKELGQLQEEEVQIILEDDNIIFKNPYMFNEVEKTLIQAHTMELLNVGLVELSRGEYASTTLMLPKNDIFGNWAKCHMCGDYHPMNKWTYSDKYVMPLLKEIFDALD